MAETRHKFVDYVQHFENATSCIEFRYMHFIFESSLSNLKSSIHFAAST
jgi:hypothetical protein